MTEQIEKELTKTKRGGVRPNSGRPKGVANKDKQELLALIQSTGCKHPIQGLAEIAKQSHDEGNLELATTCYKELSQYVAAKRKAVEHSGEIEQKGPLVVVLNDD